MLDSLARGRCRKKTAGNLSTCLIDQRHCTYDTPPRQHSQTTQHGRSNTHASKLGVPSLTLFTAPLVAVASSHPAMSSVETLRSLRK